MKATILKLAGVKSEKEFYKLFPDEASFMKKHGKEFKKAQKGAKVPKAQLGINQPPMGKQPIDYRFGENTYQELNPGYGIPSMIDPMFSNKGASGLPMLPNFTKSEEEDLDSKNWGKGLGSVTEGLVGGVQKIIDEKKQLRKAKQWKGVSDVMLQASQSIPEQPERRYVRPEDMIQDPNQFQNPYGQGTEILAKDGKTISRNIKQFGGLMPNMGTSKFAQGVGQFTDAGGTDTLSRGITALTGENAGGDLGGTLGGAVGSIFGPGGRAIGQIGGQLLGTALNSTPRETEKAQSATDRNINLMAFGQGMVGVRNQNSRFMQDGGMIEQEPMDGDLEVYEGQAEPLSYNPYSGESIMFKGKSHAQGGMDIAYGDNPANVEGGEPATEMEDNLVVYGDLPIPKEFSDFIGDPKAKGKKFKTFATYLSKQEDKQNKIIESSTEKLGALKVSTPIDKVTESSLKATIQGADMKLQSYADKKKKLADLQEAINQSAEERNLDATSLAKGKIKKAKKGTYKNEAQTGETLKPAEIVGERIPRPDSLGYNPYSLPSIRNSQVPMAYGDNSPEDDVSFSTAPFKPWQDTQMLSGAEVSSSGYNRPPPLTNATIEPSSGRPSAAPPSKRDGNLSMADLSNPDLSGDKEKAKVDWETAMMAINSVIPYLRPSDAENLDPRQLLGEMYALSNNELEPVQAQSYQPQLGTPYDVSYQDQLNEITAQSRSAERMAGHNPAAQSMMAGEAYRAKSNVLSEQFRQNQGMRERVNTENRSILNDAYLKNLGIYDQQYQRQSQAKSATKATNLEALKSISDKYLQNQLENRTLATYENLYNYRYDPRFRAQNMNPLAQFRTDGGTGPSTGSYAEQMFELQQRMDEIKDKAKEERKSKTKPNANGSILRSAKNL